MRILHAISPVLLSLACSLPQITAEEGNPAQAMETAQQQVTAAQKTMQERRLAIAANEELKALKQAYAQSDAQFKNVEQTDEGLKAARQQEQAAAKAWSQTVKQLVAADEKGKSLLTQQQELYSSSQQLHFQRDLAKAHVHSRYSPIAIAVEQDSEYRSLNAAYQQARQAARQPSSEAAATAKQAYDAAREAYDQLLQAENILAARKDMEAKRKAFEEARDNSPEAAAAKAAQQKLSAHRQALINANAGAAPHLAVINGFDESNNSNRQAQREASNALRDVTRSIERGDAEAVTAARGKREAASKEVRSAYSKGSLAEAGKARDEARKAYDSKLKELLNADSAYQEAKKQEGQAKQTIKDLQKQAKANKKPAADADKGES